MSETAIDLGVVSRFFVFQARMSWGEGGLGRDNVNFMSGMVSGTAVDLGGCLPHLCIPGAVGFPGGAPWGGGGLRSSGVGLVQASLTSVPATRHLRVGLMQSHWPEAELQGQVVAVPLDPPQRLKTSRLRHAGSE
jgi:hypothetical protein